MKTICFLLLLFCSCSHQPYRGKDVLGADDFVLDSYRVQEKQEGKIFVTGEVNKECTVSGCISLKEAIEAAGGIPFTADEACIQVMRGKGKEAKVFNLHLKHVERLPKECQMLMPGDVVYVATNFISQIFLIHKYGK